MTSAQSGQSAIPLKEPLHGFGFQDILPGIRFHHPLAIVNQPGADHSLLIVERTGRIYVVTNLAAPAKTLFLDLTAYIGSEAALEAGLLGLVFHPGFETNRIFFVYRSLEFYQPDGRWAHYNRLSRFKTIAGNPFQGDPLSEEILVDQKDLLIGTHNAGDLHFGPDGYLYVSLGDLGPPPEDFTLTRQPIDKSFFGAILRIDVDNRPGSLEPNPHPAVRGGYRIPPDNPFIGTTNYHGIAVDPAQVRTEIYALGFRNQWRFSFDPLTGQLWCGDVGENSWEELNRVVKGGNYGWPYREGLDSREDIYVSPPGFTSLPPVHFYPHGKGTDSGHAVIGGRVYTGAGIPSLYGQYIFGDNVRGNVWVLRRSHFTGQYSSRWLAGEPNISAFGIDPRNQELLVANLLTGQIKKLVYSDPSLSQFPPLLSQTGLFHDLETLSPREGLLPYEVNSPFWSDFAQKQRWILLSQSGSSITFSASNHWQFPEGTIWVKNFELGSPEPKRLSTRVLVKTADSSYGVVYKWNEEGTDAELLPPEGFDEQVQFTGLDGVARTQIWHHPSRVECLTCHNEKAGFALGVNTHQINLTLAGWEENQLDFLARNGYLTGYSGRPDSLPKLVQPSAANASMDLRVRSYLESNCASCHRPDVPITAHWDGRFHIPMHEKRLLQAPRIKPNAAHDSGLWYRLAYTESYFRMPPIASGQLDREGLRLIEEWINGMPQAPWISGDFGTPIARGSSSVRGSTLEVAGYSSVPNASPASGHHLSRRMDGAAQLLARLSQHSLNGRENKVGLLFSTGAGLQGPFYFAGVKPDRLFALSSGEETELGSAPGGDIWLRMVNEPSGLQFWVKRSGLWEQVHNIPTCFPSNFFGGFSAMGLSGSHENFGLFEEVSFLQISLATAGNISEAAFPASIKAFCSVTGEGYALEGVDLLINGAKAGEFTEPPYSFEATPGNLPVGTHSLVARARFAPGLTLDSFPFVIKITPPLAGAWFSAQDENTRGSWQSAYGQGGFFAPDFQQLPDFVRISPIQASITRASVSPLNHAALVLPDSTSRSAAYWNSSEIQIDLDFQDALLHQAGFYFADLEDRISSLEFRILDKYSGALLYQTSLGGLREGKYLLLNLRGSVRIHIQGPDGAILSGLFFDQSAISPPSLQLEPLPPEHTLPEPFVLSPLLTTNAPIKSISYWVDGLLLKTLDEAPLTLSVTGLLAGEYLFSAVATDAYDQESAPAFASTRLLLPPAKAQWLGADTLTKGNWKGAYGSDGYLMVANHTNLLPYSTVNPRDHHLFQWFIPRTEPAGLQAFEGSHRVGAVWAAPYEFPMHFALLDGHRRVVSLYAGFNHTKVRIIDPLSGTLMDERAMGPLGPGVYYRWVLQGSVEFHFSTVSGASSLNAIFLDPALSYQQWLAMHFSELELPDESLSGPFADPDTDGNSNLAEYTLGSDPLTPNSAWSMRTDSDGAILLSLNFDQSAIAVTPTIEISQDLQNWNVLTMDDDALQQVLTNGYRQLTYRVPAVAPGSSKFLRLRLIHQP